MKTPAITATLVLLALGLSGCVGGGGGTSSFSGDAINHLEELKERHIHMECTGSIQGGKVATLRLAGCSGEALRNGAIDVASFDLSGHDTNLGTARENIESTFTVQGHYPGSRSSAPITETWNIEKEQSATWEVVVKLPTDEGFGEYKFCITAIDVKDASKWWPGYQTTTVDPEHVDCFTYKVTKTVLEGFL